MCLHNSAAPTRPSRVSDLGCSTRNTSVNFDPSNLENFQAPSVDPLPRSDMNLCELSQSLLLQDFVRPDQGNFLFLIPARIDFCWPQEIKTQYKTHRIGFLERSLQAWGPRIMSRLAWTTKITALCEVSSCVNSSVFVFLAPARIIFSMRNRKFPWCGLKPQY